MSIELYDQFPQLSNEKIIIRKMTEDDLEALAEITSNDNVYKYIPHFLYKKSKGNLLAAIRNLGDRDFTKKKMIIAGIYLANEPHRLIGLAEMFDYKKRLNRLTIGYRINEEYWRRGIATNAIKLMLAYLFNEIGIDCIQAFVMPDNINSSKALLRNGFKKEESLVQGENWGGRDSVYLEVYTLFKSEYSQQS